MALRGLWEKYIVRDSASSIEAKSQAETVKTYKQTLSARVSRLANVNAAAKAEATGPDPDSYRKYLRYFDKRFLKQAIGLGERISRQMRRCVYSWLVAWANALNAFFAGPITMHHCINTAVTDDTNFKLVSTLHADCKIVRPNDIVNITSMNTYQNLLVSYSEDADPFCHHSRIFRIHQPLCGLLNADSESIFLELCSWLICAAGAVGSRLVALGLPSNLWNHTPIVGTAVCWDALSVNKVFGKLTKV